MTDRPMIAVLIETLGLTYQETVDYLQARGVDTSVNSVKAWKRGLYNPPFEAMRELVRLSLAYRGIFDDFPEGTPKSLIERHGTLQDFDHWWKMYVSVEPFSPDESGLEPDKWGEDDE